MKVFILESYDGWGIYLGDPDDDDTEYYWLSNKDASAIQTLTNVLCKLGIDAEYREDF